MPQTFRSFQERGYVSHPGCIRLNQVLAASTDLYNAELECWREQYKETGKSDSLFARMNEGIHAKAQRR